MERVPKIIVKTWVLLGVFLLAVLDWKFGGLKFTSRRADLAFGLVASWLPMICVILLGRLPRSRVRTWVLAGLIPVACLSLLVGAMAGLGQSLVLYIPQASISHGSSRIVTYLEDAGAWDSGEEVVQQEITLMPGILWVNPILQRDGVSDVKITVLDYHHVQYECAVDRYDSLGPNPAAKRGVAWVF